MCAGAERLGVWGKSRMSGCITVMVCMMDCAMAFVMACVIQGDVSQM